ncbi:MAG TPA: GNAT family N-acetyltransferase [Acidimicrobiales bacterium]|nr:GNAT family N-acetyltransferase [Acidimicrobiales bacterium]HLN43655.1 GNAT family N-acetyltransferase [Acidimicrobiales bacterium]
MTSGTGSPTVTSPVPRAVWESLLRADEGAVVTQSLAWRDAVFASGRYHDVSLLYEFPSGRQVVLPMARRRGQPHQVAMMASWPRVWGIGGPLTTGGGITPAEAAAVLDDVAGRGMLQAKITLRHDADEVWLKEARQYQIEKCGCYVLDLAGGFDEVWKHRFRGSVRTAARKAERSGVEVEVDRTGRLLGVFYDLYEKSIQRWAAQQERVPLWLTRWRMNWVNPTTPDNLALVARHFGEGCATWVARVKGEPVAAIIVLSSGTYAKGWRRAMDKELAAPVQANELLDRLSIEEACRSGHRFFDLGGAQPGSPVAASKEKLGATLHFTHELRVASPVVHTTRRLSRDLAKKVTGSE